jgi:hypothetical protein
MFRYLGFNPLHWIRQTHQMLRFVRAYAPLADSPDSQYRYAVVVTPWLGTAVPWFSVAIGMILAATGSKVAFVVDGSPFGENMIRFRLILSCVRRVLAALDRQFEVMELGAPAGGGELNAEEAAMVARKANLNAVWAMRGEMKEDGRTRYTKRIMKQLAYSAGAIRDFLARHKFDCVIVPGGVYGSSGLWAELAGANGVRLASFDSGGRGVVTIATSGVASQLQDIPRAFALLKSGVTSENQWLFVREAALAELQRRRTGTDRFSSQLHNTAELDPRFEGAVLLALNSSWDSAALGLHRVFESSARWVVETVRFLLEQTRAQVIVRQHPAERFAAGRSTDDYKRLLQETFGTDPRLTFIAAADPVNSYDLLELVSVVLVYTSTFGVEAALRGKVVITASSSYYSDLGFIWRATSLDQYNTHLRDAVNGHYTVSEQMKADALACYYLTQCCNWISSPLSPEGYNDWIRIPFKELVRQDGVQITCTALRDNVPTSFLMHLVKLRDAPLSAKAR